MKIQNRNFMLMVIEDNNKKYTTLVNVNDNYDIEINDEIIKKQ